MNDVTEEEYQYILFKRKCNKYVEYSREYGYRHYNHLDPSVVGYEYLLALKVKEATDADEMMDAVKNNNIDLVKHIFERDNIEIPYKIVHDTYMSSTGFGYEMKYEFALELAYKLGFGDIVRYLFDKNVCAQTLNRHYSSARLSDELKEYIAANEEIPVEHRRLHYLSVPAQDPRALPRWTQCDVYEKIEMNIAVLNNDIEKVEYIFRKSTEYPRKIQGYNDSSYSDVFSEALIEAVRNNRYEIFVYLIEHKVNYDRLNLLNVACPVYTKGRYNNKGGKEYDCNHIVVNPLFTYSQIELYIINVMKDVYYDDHLAKKMNGYDKEHYERNIAAIDVLNDYFMEYSVEELKNNIFLLMQAVIDNNLEEVERILSIEPKQYKSASYSTGKNLWMSYREQYKEPFEKAMELEFIDIFKCFLRHDVSLYGVYMSAEFIRIADGDISRRDL